MTVMIKSSKHVDIEYRSEIAGQKVKRGKSLGQRSQL